MKVWFVTGINRGLGRSLAEVLLESGGRVAGTARKVGELQDLQARYGDRLWVAKLDLTEAEEIQHVVDRAFHELGRIDVVVNNAGYSLAGAVEECSVEMIRHQLDTNLLGSILVVRAALPHLRAQGSGRVFQISSAAGQLAFPGLSMYHASKWGIEGFIESTAMDVAPFGIEMTLFEPGAIRTDFGNKGVLPPALEAYAESPASMMRRGVESLREGGDGSSQAPGDPRKMAVAIMNSLALSPAPKRVVMGSDVYGQLLEVYRERADSLTAQRELAFSTDHSS